ncbi:DR2241 family protein [Natrialba sp. PRR66]|uniref:DR2241 family protein n=1 Tax=Natrialba sp. PRR66 TaxID=3098146 RepID=UPI002B1DEDD7|nr:DR2241 family protein [Natrialba sp. PRR66]
MVATRHVEELVQRVTGDGDDNDIEFDGLRISRDEPDGDEFTFTLAIDGERVDRAGLDADGLREIIVGEAGEVSEGDETVDAYVTNWYYWQERVGGEGTARRAFLRWCEDAPLAGDDGAAVPARYAALRDGIDREWGQLCITARFVDGDGPDGERAYDLWHVDDADADLDDLETYDEPRAAREIATYDEDGRYRPLKTAPTLDTGWAFTGLSGTELVDAVGFFYPATIANWHREREGTLDVDHWSETASRQSGIYEVVSELPREAVDWMADACCVDSQCLRRREWEYEAGDDLDPDGGDGPFPCREPCSLVIAAARKWAIAESETERTYELELTPSERNQLEELIDAVADDRTDEIREADVNDGANRYRVRYLRAKRFADGELEMREQ